MAICPARLRHPAILGLIAIIGSNHHWRTCWKAERAMATFGQMQLKFNTCSISIITKHSGKLESMLSFLFMLQQAPFGCISLSSKIRCTFFALIRRVSLSCTFWHQPNITGTPSLLMAQCHKKLGIMDALGPPNMEIFLTLSLENMPLILLVLQIVGKSLLIRNASPGNPAIPEFTSWAVSPALHTLCPAEAAQIIGGNSYTEMSIEDNHRHRFRGPK